MYTADEIKDMLHSGIVEVTFTKADGSERVMKATLLPEYIPESTGKGDRKIELPENLVRAVDAELGEWRSFYVDKS